jgi:hypothetical protein
MCPTCVDNLQRYTEKCVRRVLMRKQCVYKYMIYKHIVVINWWSWRDSNPCKVSLNQCPMLKIAAQCAGI